MDTNQERPHVAAHKERRDNADGFDRGYFSPYSEEKEEGILANIEKVSPAFVKGYRQGKHQTVAGEYRNQRYYDPEY